MQLKSCWHSWESVTTIQFRNNSSFSIPCDLSESCSLASEPEYPKFWFQFWLLLSFVPEDILCLLEVISKALEERRNMGEQMWLCMLPAFLQSATSSEMLSYLPGPKHRPCYRQRRVKKDTCFNCNKLPMIWDWNNLRHWMLRNTVIEKKLFIFLPGKCSSLISFLSRTVKLQNTHSENVPIKVLRKAWGNTGLCSPRVCKWSHIKL